MGIKDLNTFLLNLDPNCFSKLPISNLSGYAVAVDSSLLLYAYMAASQKEIIMKTPDPLEPIDRNSILLYCREKILGFVEKFLKYNITLVWIWDGQVVLEKIKAHTRRTKQKNSIIDKINDLKFELLELHPLARDNKKLSQLRNLLTQHVTISDDEKMFFRDFLSSIGFPCFIAPYEAESLCAALAREGKVIGVWSTDTDNLALGTPILLKGFDGYDKDGHPNIEVSYTPYILHTLQFTKDEFIDFCIMLECDFNERMPNIGPKKSHKYIEKYRTIEKAIEMEPHLPWVNLNHEKCRELFMHIGSDIEFEELRLNTKAPELRNVPNLLNLFRTVPNPTRVVFQ
jgi:flap endonuclease-1